MIRRAPGVTRWAKKIDVTGHVRDLGGLAASAARRLSSTGGNHRTNLCTFFGSSPGLS